MTADTQNWLVKLAGGALAVLSVITLLSVTLIAVLRDGAIEQQVVSTFLGVLQTAVPALAALAGIHTVAQAVVSYKINESIQAQLRAGAQQAQQQQQTAPGGGNAP